MTCGCATMPVSPRADIASTNQGSPSFIPAGAVIENMAAGSCSCSPERPPTTARPAGININDSTMIITPCSTSVKTADTSPPAMTYVANVIESPMTDRFMGSSPPVAPEIAAPAPRNNKAIDCVK